MEILCKSLVFATFFSENIPECYRIAVGCKESGMHDIELAVGFDRCHVVALVISVGHKMDRSVGHLCEILLHKRRYGNDCCRVVENALLQFMMLPFCPFAEHEVLEVEYLCPRVSEVSDPWNPCRQRDLPCYEMHRLWRAGADDNVYRMLFQVFLEISYGRIDPETTWVRHEEVASYPH